MTESGRIAMVLGIRPDVIRASLIIRILSQRLPPDRFEFVWSGQHYSENMKDVFFRQLEVPYPGNELGAKGATDFALAADVVMKLGHYLQENRPSAVAFLGDTNTVVGCLAAAALNIPIVHIEGCMRSYDWRMPEEKYRTTIDHLSDVIYAYLPTYAAQGTAEGIPEHRIVVTGNPIVDVLEHYFVSGKIRLSGSDRARLLRRYDLEPNEFLLMTCHRRENVESPFALEQVMRVAQNCAGPVIFPASYRTQRELQRNSIVLPENVRMIDPIGYVEFLEFLDASQGVLTDSGTVVEEASILMKPSVQMRRSTERPEVYEVGGSIAFDPGADVDIGGIRNVIQRLYQLGAAKWEHTLGDGRASQRIADDLVGRLEGGDFANHQPETANPLVARAYMRT